MKRHLHAVGGIAQVAPAVFAGDEIALLPGVDAIHARGPRHFGRLHEFHGRRIAAERGAQKIFGQRARRSGVDGRARRFLGDLVLKAHELAGRRDIDAVLFFLQRAEPAVAPAPQPHPRPHDAVGAFQARFPLQEGLGLVVEIETRGLPVAVHGVMPLIEKTCGQGLRAGAIHPEIDGSLGKGA